jgi:hypothetical protein
MARLAARHPPPNIPDANHGFLFQYPKEFAAMVNT